MNQARLISIVVVVVLVIIVIGIVLWITRRRISKPSSDSRQESDSRISVSAPRGESRYRVTKGRLIEDQPQQGQEQPKVEVQAAAHEFPRNLAQAGNKMNDYLPKNSQETPQKLAVNNPHADQTAEVEEEQEGEGEVEGYEQPPDSDHEANHSRSRNQSYGDSPSRLVTVARLADLFSPKENLEEDLGVDQAELEKMVTAYKKKTEYKERRLPVNAHFNIQDYRDSKNVMRESAINVNSTRGSKKGQITAQIYKKHGKNFTVQRHDVTGGNMAIEDDVEHKAPVKLPRNQGKLVVH